MIAARTLARRLSVPRLLRALTIAVAVEAGLLALAGLGGSASAQDGVTRSADLHSLHLALADADRHAADEFLSGCKTTNPNWTTATPVQLTYCPGKVESGGDRLHYTQAILTATTDLKRVAQDSGADGGASQQLQGLDADVTRYSTLMETGRADTRLGLPVGAAYLRAASTLMHPDPDPKHPDTTSIRAQVDALDSAGAIPGRVFLATALLLTIVLLATLVAGQAYLRRRFRRRYNVGLGAATLLLVPVVAWTGLLAADSGPVPGQALDRWHNAQRAQAWAHYAAADESRALIPGGNDTAFRHDVGELSALIAGTPVEPAVSGPHGLVRTQQAMSNMVKKGQLGDAIVLLSRGNPAGCDPNGFEGCFARLDQQLDALIRNAADQLTRGLGLVLGAAGSVDTGASGAIRLLPAAVGLAVVLLVGLGLRPRIDEYRRLR
jgi:hypothetical protein